MAENFFSLSDADQREALLVSASRSGRPAYLLEKDVRVVWLLRTLFAAPFGNQLTFKGGTSLSKAYKAIQRFSEDVDLTYDIREIAGDVVATTGVIPTTRSQQEKLTKAVRDRLPQWLGEKVIPQIESAITQDGTRATVTLTTDTIEVHYPPIIEGPGYVRPVVLLEFGARSTGEPRDACAITCDAAEHLTDVEFPEALAQVMHAERTFWEKATAVHVYCHKAELGGYERLSRHWYDLVCLDDAGIADQAIKDTVLKAEVAHHKSMFFREKDAAGTVIDYNAAVSGSLCLVPSGQAMLQLADDYARMIDGGLFMTTPPSFDEVVARCSEIQEKANSVR